MSDENLSEPQHQSMATGPDPDMPVGQTGTVAGANDVAGADDAGVPRNGIKRWLSAAAVAVIIVVGGIIAVGATQGESVQVSSKTSTVSGSTNNSNSGQAGSSGTGAGSSAGSGSGSGQNLERMRGPRTRGTITAIDGTTLSIETIDQTETTSTVKVATNGDTSFTETISGDLTGSDSGSVTVSRQEGDDTKIEAKDVTSIVVTIKISLSDLAIGDTVSVSGESVDGVINATAVSQGDLGGGFGPMGSGAVDGGPGQFGPGGTPPNGIVPGQSGAPTQPPSDTQSSGAVTPDPQGA